MKTRPLLRRLPGHSPFALAAAALLGAAAASAGTEQVMQPTAASLPTVAPVTARLVVKYRNAAAGQNPSERAKAAMQVAANRQGVQVGLLRSTASGAHVYRISRALSHADAQALDDTPLFIRQHTPPPPRPAGSRVTRCFWRLTCDLLVPFDAD